MSIFDEVDIPPATSNMADLMECMLGDCVIENEPECRLRQFPADEHSADAATILRDNIDAEALFALAHDLFASEKEPLALASKMRALLEDACKAYGSKWA